MTELREFIGRDSGVKTAKVPINETMIRHWCIALGDDNSLYQNAEVAQKTICKGIVAPPAMLQAWTMPEYGELPDVMDAINELYAALDAQGYTGIVATNSEQDYFQPLYIGDRISSRKIIEDISEEKKTGLGKGFFITSTIVYENQNGVVVGRQLHRVLKFKPEGVCKEDPKALRPRPNVTLDTAFYFEAAKQHKLLIQCCDTCSTLQHPPLPSCRACGALDLSPTEMSGRGTLFSYTIVHRPVLPAFDAPYPVILVDLEEGPRVVSELHGVPLEDIKIGMPLQVDFIDCDPELSLPIFRLREEGRS